ncbi:MAG: ATP-binding protein [Candidatus Krumholzibacteriota bacterium]|nr:ATP-binding protein [Candidatus Krumholzibacteriota bacterium]
MFSKRSLLLLFAVFATMIVAALFASHSFLARIILFGGIVYVSVITTAAYRNHTKKVKNIQDRLSSLKSEGLFVDSGIIEGKDIFYNTILAILKDLERTIFKLVEKNIQLLSLKEIGRNIISSLDEKKLTESVFDYLMHGIGYKEVAFIIARRKEKILQGVINIEKNNKIKKRILNFDISNLEGAIFNSLQTGKSFLIRDTEQHPLEKIGKKDLFPGSTMSSYICVPMMNSKGKTPCGDPDRCVLMKDDREERRMPDDPYLTDNRCLSCPHLPLLGMLIVSDGYRATQLTNIDQVTVETVGTLVSSNIENWLLYQGLRQAEIFMEKVFESMSHGLFVTDLEGNITFANRSAKEMSKMDTNILEQKSVFDLIIDKNIGKEEYSLGNMLSREGIVSFHEGYLKRSDGYHIPIRMTTSQFLGEKDEVQGAIVLFVDRSDIKKMEEEIRHLDRLAVLGRFTSAIAHEIRNPLAGIGAGVQYLKRSGRYPRKEDKSIDSILSEVERLNRIITDLFKVVKPSDILYQKADISELIDKSYNSIKDLFLEKGVEFNKQIDDNVEPVEVDPDQIIQVLINLFKNAAEATEENGRVEVKAKSYNEKITDHNIREKKKILKVEIADNGKGIDKESLGKIFEPFFSKNKNGTGLGLYITHSIIHRHHGNIDVLSKEHKGTTFKITLPLDKYGR